MFPLQGETTPFTGAQVLALYNHSPQPCSSNVLRTVLPPPRGDQSFSPSGAAWEKMGPCLVTWPTAVASRIPPVPHSPHHRAVEQEAGASGICCAPVTEPVRPAPIS